MGFAITLGADNTRLTNIASDGLPFDGLGNAHEYRSVLYEIQTGTPVWQDVGVVEELIGFSALSEQAFAEDWNSPADSIYDDNDHP